MQFNQSGISIDDIVNIIVYEKEFTKFLLDIQNEYRIQRAMQEDEGDRMLIASRVIDDIIDRVSKLDQARKEYYENLNKPEENE